MTSFDDQNSREVWTRRKRRPEETTKACCILRAERGNRETQKPQPTSFAYLAFSSIAFSFAASAEVKVSASLPSM